MVQFTGSLDEAFTALADPTRRGILEALGTGEASISALADRFDMTLTGVTKHVRLLEAAGLVRTEKRGRVRTCRLGTRRLDPALDWITSHHRRLAQRLDHLGDFLERTAGAH
jgi:DNA-binding transcriptional ArsR family regulator